MKKQLFSIVAGLTLIASMTTAAFADTAFDQKPIENAAQLKSAIALAMEDGKLSDEEEAEIKEQATEKAAADLIIDASVEAKYAVKKTASTSTSSSVTGTFKPSGNYRYSAVVFTPRLATITGILQMRQVWEGNDTILSKYDMTWRYPCVTSGGLMDGIYKLQESNYTSSFPD